MFLLEQTLVARLRCRFLDTEIDGSRILEHIGRLARMSILDTEVDGSNPGSSMLFP